jgi:hypothetical protein
MPSQLLLSFTVQKELLGTVQRLAYFFTPERKIRSFGVPTKLTQKNSSLLVTALIFLSFSRGGTSLLVDMIF